jgi:hypothetical protein
MKKHQYLPVITKFLSFLGAVILPIIIAVIVLLGSIRGNWGSPDITVLNDTRWTENGPFELSPERGRFALMYSIIEENSFQFSLPIAKFAAPDVSINNGSFVSMFAPGLSLIIIPGYLVGKYLGLAQVGAYSVISLFAVLNFLLIRYIASKIGAKLSAATIAALLFLFGSPAYAYGVSLYQHHVSTFLILLALAILLKWKNIKSLILIWIICGVSVMIDNPNFFFMLPIGIYALTRLISIETTKEKVKIQLKPLGVLTLFSFIFPVSLFLYINFLSYGNPFQLAGTNQSGEEQISQLIENPDLATIAQIDENLDIDDAVGEQTEEKKSRSAVAFFKTRNLPNGLYTHLLSLDRGMIMYTPVLLLGFLGLILLPKSSLGMKKVLVSTVTIVVLIYSLWGDPYGGWAFGSRYLIPAYAVLSIGLAVLLSKYSRSFLLISAVLILGSYSIAVNTIGALTTNRIPPKVQVLALEEISSMRQRYTYTRNIEMLDSNHSKSFVFNNFVSSHFTAWEYTSVLIGIIEFTFLLFLVSLFLRGRSIPSKDTRRIRHV